MLILAKSRNGGWYPATDQDKRKSDRIGYGEMLKCTKSRNIKFHNKMMALFRLCYENMPDNPVETEYGMATKSFDRVRKEIMITAGHFDIVIGINGEGVLEAKSLRFESMDDTEAKVVYNDCRAIVAQALQIATKDIDEEVALRIRKRLEQF